MIIMILRSLMMRITTPERKSRMLVIGFANLILAATAAALD
jgi:hypothetical protein|tara:strand:- start:144 stop:266 length:123 start_codon:yes stop_codon:yes gene_type:complete